MSRVSVIIPVYNAEKYLKRCVDSILSQTFVDFELILVDDGSPDDSGKICDDYRCIDNRVRVIHQENQGVSGARQTGLDAASGDFVIFADPDDWIELTMLEELIEKAEAEDADVVICDMICEHLVDGKIESRLFVQKPKAFDSQSIMSQLLLGELYGSTANKLYRNKTLKRSSITFPYSINFCEDLWFNCKLFLNQNIKVTYLNRALYHYDQYSNDNSLTKSYGSRMVQDYLLFAGFLEEHLDNSLFTKELKWVKFNAKKIAFRSDCDSKEFYSIYPEAVESSKQILSKLSLHFIFKWGFWLALCGCLKSGRNLMRIYNNCYLPIAKWRYNVVNNH